MQEVKAYQILAINPGSTSTKIAVYENEAELFREEIFHDQETLLQCPTILSQMEMRNQSVAQALEKHQFDLSSLSGVVGRGGMIPHLGLGGYLVNDALRQVIQSGKLISHASNLGALMAYTVAQPLGIPACIYDAVSAGELSEMARITGIPEIQRESFCHVLNTRAMARKYATQCGKAYKDLDLIILHMGGGTSVTAHSGGMIVDVISDDGGPFSPERAGSLPVLDVIDLCFSGQYTKEQMIRKHRGNGGLKGLLGTSDCREIERRIEAGDSYAQLCYQAQAYQMAKGIGNLAPALNCRIDAIILTGGAAHSKMLTEMITSYVSALAPVIIMAGENEMEALSLGLLRILRGEEPIHEYTITDN